MTISHKKLTHKFTKVSLHCDLKSWDHHIIKRKSQKQGNSLRGKWQLLDCAKTCGKVKKFKKISWIQSHHIHLQWKFKLLVGKFTWVVTVHIGCWVMPTNFFVFKILLSTLSNVLLPKVNFPANNLNFHWRWRWWDQSQAIFLNHF